MRPRLGVAHWRVPSRDAIRPVPAFELIRFEGGLTPTERVPCGRITWDGDDRGHDVEWLWGRSFYVAWGPVPPGAERVRWLQLRNVVAGRLMDITWARTPELSERFGEEPMRHLVWKFSDQVIANLRPAFTLTGADILAWIHTGKVPEFADCTPQLRNQLEAEYIRAMSPKNKAVAA